MSKQQLPFFTPGQPLPTVNQCLGLVAQKKTAISRTKGQAMDLIGDELTAQLGDIGNMFVAIYQEREVLLKKIADLEKLVAERQGPKQEATPETSNPPEVGTPSQS